MFGFGNHDDTYTSSGEKKPFYRRKIFWGGVALLIGGYLTGEAGLTETMSKIYHLFIQ